MSPDVDIEVRDEQLRSLIRSTAQNSTEMTDVEKKALLICKLIASQLKCSVNEREREFSSKCITTMAREIKRKWSISQNFVSDICRYLSYQYPLLIESALVTEDSYTYYVYNYANPVNLSPPTSSDEELVNIFVEALCEKFEMSIDVDAEI